MLWTKFCLELERVLLKIGDASWFDLVRLEYMTVFSYTYSGACSLTWGYYWPTSLNRVIPKIMLDAVQWPLYEQPLQVIKTPDILPLSSSPHWDLFFWYGSIDCWRTVFFQFTKLFLDLDSIIFFRFFQQPMNQCNNIARLVFRLFIMPIILDIMPKYFITEYFITKYILALGLYAWWWY